MNTVFLKINQWENSRPVECALPLNEGDLVIVETKKALNQPLLKKLKLRQKKRSFLVLKKKISASRLSERPTCET